MSVIWYECKVKYPKLDEVSGTKKLKTEPFLYLSDGEGILITNIKVANYAEIHPFENADRWFKAKISLIAFDEESGKERKTNEYLLVQANDVKEAYENTMHAMKDTMGEFSIPSIAESPIVDVFPYFTGEEENSERLEEFLRLKESVPADNAEDEALAMEDSLTA